MLVHDTCTLVPAHLFFTIKFMQHDDEAEEGELVSVICNAYQGSNKPAACS